MISENKHALLVRNDCEFESGRFGNSRFSLSILAVYAAVVLGEADVNNPIFTETIIMYRTSIRPCLIYQQALKRMMEPVFTWEQASDRSQATGCRR